MRAVYQALKPGGVFILIDHAGSGMDNAKLHRMEQIAEALARDAGFPWKRRARCCAIRMTI